jgi:hypothetical protein
MVKNEKILGYVLLGLGIALLLFSIVEMLYVYYGIILPPNLVSTSDISLPGGQNGANVTLLSGVEMSQILNLSFWYLLMFFIMAAGGKIASLGVSMVKDIKVEVKEALLTPKETNTR